MINGQYNRLNNGTVVYIIYINNLLYYCSGCRNFGMGKVPGGVRASKPTVTKHILPHETLWI